MSRVVRRLAVGLAVVCLILPLLPVWLWAGADRWTFPSLLPQEWGTRGWRGAIQAGLPSALASSFILAILVSAIATPVGVAIGRVLGWRLTHHPRMVLLLLLAPVVLPSFAVAMGLDVLVVRSGVPPMTAVVALLVVAAVPYTAYTCAVGFARTPATLEEQARALGATTRQAHWRVVLPAVRTSILVAALLSFLVGWSDYIITVVIGGGQVITAPVLLGSAASGSGNEPSVAAMALPLLAVPVLLVALAARASDPREEAS